MTFPPLPDAHAIAVMALVVVALVLFTRERIPLESTSFFVLVVLAVGFELFPYLRDGRPLRAVDFFSGFGHEALVAVVALMIAGHGLVRTGALEPFGRLLARAWRFSPTFSLLLTLIIGGFLSAFVNNTPIVVLLLPILTGVSMRAHTPASGILMPMGFATIIGGMTTTIGTSTNLLVVSMAADIGLDRFGMFDFLVPAATAAGIGILYLWLVAPRLIPARTAPLADGSPRVFNALLHVREDSFADGKTLAEAIKKVGKTMRVSRIQRADDAFMVPLPDVVLRAGDRLRVNDTPEHLKEYERALGATLYSGDAPVNDEHPLAAEDQQIAEVVVEQGSPLEGATLEYLRATNPYQVVTLALHRAGRQMNVEQEALRDMVLRVGDVVLVQGARDDIAKLKRSGELLVLDATTDIPHTSRAPLAAIIMGAIVVAAASGFLPISISAVFGVLLMLLSRCLGWSDIGRALNTSVIMVVVASLALGLALLETGGADYLARLFVALSFGAQPAFVLSGLILLMAVLTNMVSNNAVAVIGTPIAISIARQLGLPPEPFVLAVLFGANMSYMTPMGYNTNLLVMNAGGYRFSDFVRVGTPLTLLLWLVFSWMLPWLYW
jgi:di/tricarboxylate transporter